jgi:uncharacterized membrane protein YccC
MTLDLNPSQLHYRLARKHLVDAIAALGSAIRSMLEEPESRRHAVEPLNTFLTDSYLMAAQLASVRLLIQQRGGELDPVSLPPRLDQAAGEISLILAGEKQAATDHPFASEVKGSASSAHAQLLQRLDDLRDGAREIAELAEYITAS